MTRRWILAALAAALAAIACAELAGVRDLSCASPDGAPVDTCVGEGGVTILPASGELHGLTWTNGTLVAVGYDDSDGGTELAIRVVSPSGDVVDQIVQDGGTANAVAPDLAASGAWVAGGDGAHFMVRHFTVGPLKLDQTADFATTKDGPDVALSEAVAYTNGADGTLYGTSVTGDLAIVRIDSTAGRVHDAVFNGSTTLRATGGVAGESALTIVGDTPDASLGLAMARFLAGSGGPAPDSTFGDGGAMLAKFGDGGSARAVLLADDSSYWVGGQAAGASGFVLMRVTAGGAVDQSWTAPGPNRGLDAILAVDGGVLGAGFADGKLAVARFTLDAGIDTTFGDAGVLELPFEGELRALVQTNNRFVAGGFAVVGGTKRWVLVWLVPN